MQLRLPAGLRRARLRQFSYAPLLALAMSLMLMRLLVMARMLDLRHFADYSGGLLVSSSFLMLGCLGLQSLLQRELPVLIVRHREHDGGVLLLQCGLVAAACAGFGVALVLVGGFSLAGLSPTMVALALVHGLSLQLFLIATVESRSRGQAMRFARQNLARAVILIFLDAAIAELGGEAAAVLAIEAISSLVLSLLFFRRQLHAIPMRFSFACALAWRQLPAIKWRSAFTLLALASLGFVVINCDRWLAAQRLSVTAFAQYAFGWTLLMVAQSVQVVINASLFPFLARCFGSQGGLIAFDATARASLALLACGAVLALPLWLLLDYSISRWFVVYQEVRSLLPIFLFISVLRVSDFWSSYLLVVGREARLLLLNLLSLPVATVAWLLLAKPEADDLRIDQVALLALLLAAIGYAVGAWAAWHCSEGFRKEAA